MSARGEGLRQEEMWLPPAPADGWGRRFGALARLYGEAAVPVLRGLHVCVVGLGGVGCWTAEALARSGVGALTLIDGDTVCETNTNRQLHALAGTVGRPKAEVMAERIAAIHPDCRVTAVAEYLTDASLEALVDPARGYGYVVDAIDSIRFKAALIARCRRLKIPVLTTGAAGGLTDPTRVQVRDLSRTRNDPLAAKVRARLRARHGFSRNPKRSFGVPCVHSTEQQRYPRPDGTVGHEKPGVCGVSLDCRAGYGSAAFVTAVFGMAAAAEVVNRTLARRLARRP